MVCGQCLANNNNDEPPAPVGLMDPVSRTYRPVVVHGKSGGDEQGVLLILTEFD